MGRNATLHIQNETGYDLVFVSSHVDHGKFQDHWSPPSQIAAGTTGTFEVGNHTGAKIGPKGSVTYKLTYPLNITPSPDAPGQTPTIEVDLIFYWDHPFSASTSTYEVASNPPWFGSYYLNPPAPTGHNQEVTYVTRLNDYGFDPKTWMAQIGNSKAGMALRDIMLPGSHDSATYPIHYGSALTLDYESWIIPLGGLIGVSQGWAKAQNSSILDQLNSGVRYLDLRFSNGIYATSPTTGSQFTTIGPDDPVPIIPSKPPQPAPNVVRTIVQACHSYAGASPETIWNDVKTFVNQNPKEIVLINIQHTYNFNQDTFSTLIDQIQTAFGDKLLSRTSNVASLTLQTLWDANKQILLFIHNNHEITTSGEPQPGTEFKDTFPDLYNANDFIWSEDLYLDNYYPDTCDISTLQTDLANNISYDQSKFSVLQGIITPDTSFPSSNAIAYSNGLTGKYPKNLEQLGNDVTPQVCQWVNNLWNAKPLNIIMVDWICNSVITQICYMLNKR